METIKKAIKHFECVKSDAVAVLDSGFGTKPNESNIVYKNRKLYAELAINALEKQIPKKPVKKNPIVYQKDKDGQDYYAYDYHCPFCDRKVLLYEHHCLCGQTISWNPQ